MGVISISIGAAFISAIVLYYLRYHRRFSQLVNALPGIPTVPILGNLNQLHSDSEDFFEQMHILSRIYHPLHWPRVVRVWLTCLLPYVVVFGADELEAVLGSNNVKKSREYVLLYPWLGRGLLTNENPAWKPRRKLLTPTFHYDILKDFVEIFYKQSLSLCHTIEGHIETEPGTAIEAYSKLTLMALDVISESAMGRAIGAQQNPDLKYVKAVYLLNDIIFQRQKQPWLWPDVCNRWIGRGKEMDECLKILHDMTNNIVSERRSMRAADNSSDAPAANSKRRAFLDLLLDMEEAGDIDAKSLHDEVTTFMFEGHDTTTASMTWTLLLLGNHPEWQAKVQQELDEVFDGDVDRVTTFDDLTHMPLLDCCIKESLRLYPSVPIMGRQIEFDVDIGRGYTIPRGSTVLLNYYSLHREERHWPDAETFDPTRFTAEASKGRHPFAYLPFSAGSRNCIGQRFAMMELRTVLSTMLRRFTFHAVHRTDEVRMTSELILRPKGGVWLNFTRRAAAKHI